VLLGARVMNAGTQTVRGDELAREHLRGIAVRTDRLFGVLLGLQFIAGVAAAFMIAPRTWAGPVSSVHAHIYAAVCIGFVITALPVWMILRRPGTFVTRCTVGVAQLLFSALFIHLSGGRIETHFHVFGSLAFLAFYRDWRVLIPATLVAAADHIIRGIYWPESIFGVIAAAPWRAFEHIGWVVFEDIFLVYSCVQSAREARYIAERRAELEDVNATIECEVRLRTAELENTVARLSDEMAERQRLEGQLVQAQKLESIGQLAAGIAHEINTPAQYVSDNAKFLEGEFEGILKVLDHYANLLDADAPAESWPERVGKIRATLGEVDFDFLREEIPNAISQSLEGIDRITHIVRAMKDFSHPGTGQKESVDLNQAIASTVTVCKNRWKYAAELELDLDPGLPAVRCHLAELNQVILNLVVNAADAIESRFKGTNELGRIVVSTRAAGEWIEISVADNGGGVPEAIRERIFDPFFTTKEVGKGTGQGLAISRDVVVQKHGGELRCDTEPGVGTTFVVRLPAHDEALKEAA